GTLDPMAGGVLILCLGTATRISEYLLGGDKQYRATVRLGQTTTTYDAEGQFLEQSLVTVGLDQIESALPNFRGTISQVPPAFSAVQVGGRRAYNMARHGETPNLAPRSVTIHGLDLISWQSPDLTLNITCSAGTYIRSLAHDLGRALGCGGYLTALSRTAAGGFTLEDAHELSHIESTFKAGNGATLIRPTDHALSSWPVVSLDAAGANRILHGNPVPIQNLPQGSGLGRAYDPNGCLIAIVEADPASGQWKPKKVLATA
ncbi:MAG: tRNA pseudouridine(55) synthase TruB, partial [Chloroflexi bacterium]|nr:tRNA pseudouridine(55) synthase TruB [Chloroflexota bacterium]